MGVRLGGVQGDEESGRGEGRETVEREKGERGGKGKGGRQR